MRKGGREGVYRKGEWELEGMLPSLGVIALRKGVEGEGWVVIWQDGGSNALSSLLRVAGFKHLGRSE